MSHYFENDNSLKSEIKRFKVNINDNIFEFNTDNGVFSKGELDFGTYLLIKNVLLKDIHGKVLDLGCGYGPIGIIIKKIKDVDVMMCDINKRALHLTKMNAKLNGVFVNILESNGLENINDHFDYIISNPPIRIGKTNLYKLINDSMNSLCKEGELLVVIRKEQGALSFVKDMKVKYDVNILDKQKGFFIISLKRC